MKFIFFTFFLNTFIFSSGFSDVSANNEIILSSDDHCVAYSTPEKILFFPNYLVIGKSCEIKASLENNETQSRFLVEIPIESFDSGIDARDRDVMEILKADNYPNILFKTDWLSKKELKNILLEGIGEIKGFLMISGRKYLTVFNLIVSKKGSNYVFRASFDTDYTFFNLEPPKLGFFAEVLNSIKIHVNLQSNKIEGFKIK